MKGGRGRGEEDERELGEGGGTRSTIWTELSCEGVSQVQEEASICLP